MTLADFLAARLDEDEAAAKAAAADGPGWQVGSLTGAISANTSGTMIARGYWDEDLGASGPHIARHDPARVLREVEAGRQLLASLRQAQERLDHAPPGFYQRLAAVRDAWQEAVRQRAAVWSDHPDYDAEWAPPPVAESLGEYAPERFALIPPRRMDTGYGYHVDPPAVPVEGRATLLSEKREKL